MKLDEEDNVVPLTEEEKDRVILTIVEITIYIYA
jgi:hypothetical protein